MRKICSLCLAITLTTSLFCAPAMAVSKSAETYSVQTAAKAFLQSYTESTLLNTERDLTINTVSDAAVPVTVAKEMTFELTSGTATLTDMQENISYIKEKAAFLKAAREAQNITRTGLKLNYVFSDVSIDGNTAAATISETASFYYTGETQQSFAETIYTVDLIKVDGKWLIADVYDNDWFDDTYKASADTFSATAAMEDFETVQSIDACDIHLIEDEPGVRATASYQIPYNADSATAYAYTYTRQTGTGNWQEYYNQDFTDFRADGGDCMNFASQCMWAGFSGSQTRSGIDAHNAPMDSAGTTAEYKWYSCSKDYYSSRLANSTGSWRSCSAFRTYIDNSNTSSDIGLKCNTANVASGANFSGVTTTALKGAVCHVTGSDADYGHAIVLTDVNGLARNQIYLCAHSTDRKFVKLGDYYATCPIKAFMPQYLRVSTSPSNYLKVDMLRPIARGSTGSLRCYTSAAQYKFTIGVKAPSGAFTSASSTAANPTSFTYNYNFTESGLYKIDCYSKATSTSTAQTVTFYVLSFTI